MQTFFANPLKFPPGTVLVVEVNKSLKLDLRNFVQLQQANAEYVAWWDFGTDNVVRQSGNSSTGNDGSNTGNAPAGEFYINQKFPTVGVFTLRMLVDIGNAYWERFQWEFQVACQAGDVKPGGAIEYLAATHATFDLPGGPRHVIIPLPKWSSDAYDSYFPPDFAEKPSDGELSGPEIFNRGLEVFSRQFQQCYAYGFGRIPVPSEQQVRGVHVHMLAESMIYGTNTTLLGDLTALELRMREALSNRDQADALTAIKPNLDLIFAMSPDLSELSRVNLVGGNILVPGKRTIRALDVATWRRYAIGAVDESKTFGGYTSATPPVSTAMTLKDWRQYQGQFDRELPEFDMGAAWRWEVTQAIHQAVSAMYTTFAELGSSTIGPNGRPWSMDDSCVLFTAAPGSDTVSLRIYDTAQLFWAQLTLAKSGPDGHIELNQMADLAADLKLGGNGYVAARVVGVMNVGEANQDIPHVFDVQHVEDALNGALFAYVPSIMALPPGVSTFREVVGTDAAKTLGPDGTSYVTATGPDATASTVGVPAIKMPDGKDVWSSLRPHALFVTLNGAMTPVARRP